MKTNYQVKIVTAAVCASFLFSATAPRAQSTVTPNKQVIASPILKKPVSPATIYLNDVAARLRNFWITANARPGKVSASWKIQSDGTVSDIKITKHGPNSEYDKAILACIKAGAPYATPPSTASQPFPVEISFDPPRLMNLSVGQAASIYGPPARKLMQTTFKSLNVSYPPKKLKWVSLKEERRLLVFAPNNSGQWTEIMNLPIRGLSGTFGPKLKVGDLQAPEGFYKIAKMDASIKLIMWVNYPNAQDWSHAAKEHRISPGYGIQIHGGAYSTGCLAMGNNAIQELWVLAHDTGIKNVELIYAPCNLTVREPKTDMTKQPAWVHDLYKQLKASLSTLPITEQMDSPRG